MFCFIGLGNPGKTYVGTRHNVGFMILDMLLKVWSFPGFSNKFSGHLSLEFKNKHKVCLFKPMSFMNFSGKPILELVRFYKVNLNSIIVIHDDIDLEPNTIKIKIGGSSTHNGIKSINNTIGRDYWRIRIGVGKTQNINTSKYVLSEFKEINHNKLQKLCNCLHLLLSEDQTNYHNILNKQMNL